MHTHVPQKTALLHLRARGWERAMLINEESLRSASPYGSDMHGVPGCCVFVLQIATKLRGADGPEVLPLHGRVDAQTGA